MSASERRTFYASVKIFHAAAAQGLVRLKLVIARNIFRLNRPTEKGRNFSTLSWGRIAQHLKQDFLLETLKSTFLNEIHFVLAKLRNVLINDHHVIVRPENWFTFWGHGSNCEMLKQHFAYIFWF